jgi:ketosteroid isomerase-like protein
MILRKHGRPPAWNGCRKLTDFFNGENAIRGKDNVANAWQVYYDSAQAPFSWQPETVEVLDSGTLTLSGGPVYDPAGNLTARFSSIWRRQREEWKIVFDKGSEMCRCE